MKSNRAVKSSVLSLILFGVIVGFAFLSYYFIDDKILSSVSVDKVPVHIKYAMQAFYMCLEIIPLIIFVWIGAISAGKDKWRFIGQLILSLVVAGIVCWFVKSFVTKPYPHFVHRVHWFEKIIVGFLGESYKTAHSLPASEIALTFVFVSIFAHYFPTHRLVFYFVGCFVALSSLFLGVNYLSSIIAGGLVGYISAWLIIYLLTFSGR